MAPPVRRSTSQGPGWDPIREFEDLYEQMGRLMPSTLGGETERATWVPATDLSESEDAYVVEVELPGVKQEDINIDVSGTEVAITGEVKERERVGLLRRRTRRVGEFEYRITLPDDIDVDNIDANLSDGVLTVRIPKTEGAKRRRIEINQT